MASYFLDTSALIKRYVSELGHAWINSICTPTQGHALYISQAAMVEAVATLCRKAREQSISEARRDALINLFLSHRRRGYEVVRVTNVVYTAAGNLCRSHKLRAYDAVQLACALAVRTGALAHNTPIPTFVCADHDLLAVAATEGLATENPNRYP